MVHVSNSSDDRGVVGFSLSYQRFTFNLKKSIAIILRHLAAPQQICRWPYCGYISHHRPPAISRKIGSVWRAGGGSGAERRSRNSVRARSYAFGNGAPVAVWPRARTRVASPAVLTPHKVPADSEPFGARVEGARILVARRPQAASGAVPARWPPCSGGGAWRCCGWSCSVRLPPARPPAPRKMCRRRSLIRTRPPTPLSRRRHHRPTRPHTPVSTSCRTPLHYRVLTCRTSVPPTNEHVLFYINTHTPRFTFQER